MQKLVPAMGWSITNLTVFWNGFEREIYKSLEHWALKILKIFIIKILYAELNDLFWWKLGRQEY